MDLLWERVRALEGRQIPTLTGRASFRVLRVTDATAHIPPRGAILARRIPRRTIERAESLGRAGEPLTPTFLRRHKVTNGDASYVVALLRALADPEA